MTITSSLRCELLLKGGHMIDPANGIDQPMDVAIAGRKIAAVAPDIPASASARVADVSGLLVVPGLVDIHAHAFGYAASMFPDEMCLPFGVTTMVDAGGSGWRTFDEFNEQVIRRSPVRVYALLNIVGAGMTGDTEQNVEDMDVEATAAKIRQRGDRIVGVKAAHFQGPGWEAVDRAVQAARATGTFAMIDQNARPTRTADKMLLEHMGPGDVATHCFALGKPMVSASGDVKDHYRKARERGVRFDVGHGNNSFSFRMAVAATKQGFPPDTISTDMHRSSYHNSFATMTETMTKMLAAGLPLQEVVRLSTLAPARQINRVEHGTLSVGADADIAVLQLAEGRFGLTDSGPAGYRVMRVNRRIIPQVTIAAGIVRWDLNGLTRDDWTNTPPPDESMP